MVYGPVFCRRHLDLGLGRFYGLPCIKYLILFTMPAGLVSGHFNYRDAEVDLLLLLGFDDSTSSRNLCFFFFLGGDFFKRKS